ncbi:MAG: ribonuclease P protein component [Robiginitomaculum sp.]|nr:MAG: ribonuclease P protein component [Robiginitomaculum sp.]
MATHRLTIRKQFLYVARGQRAARPNVVVQARKAVPEQSGIRAGFTATKKIGNAVTRNRSKRRLRAAVHELLVPYGQPGWDYVFIARKATADVSWSVLLDDMKAALLRLR